MPNLEDAAQHTGKTLVAADGTELGTIDDVYLTTGDDGAVWASVALHDRTAIVPLDGADLGETVKVRYTAEQVQGAPEASGDALDQDQASDLYEHYGIADSTLRDDDGFTATDVGERADGVKGDPRSGGGDDGSVGHP
jgi:hypothetical protein